MKAYNYIKAIKKADREIELENNPGFKSKTRIHASKKVYNRKKVKKLVEQVEN